MSEKTKTDDENYSEKVDKDISEFSNTVSPETQKFDVTKKLKTFKPSVNPHEIQALEDNYINEVKTSPKYSLEVDPENQYNFSDEQKEFIKTYCEFNNLPLTAQLCKLEEDEALNIYRMLSVQAEIRRIRLARYHKSFAGKMLNISEIGGYLTALLMDEVPISDRINTNSKMKVIELLVKINEMKSNVINDKTIIDAINIEDQIKDLSLESIQQMIATATGKTPIKTELDQNKEDIICQIQEQNNERLTTAELGELRAMSLESLVEILNNMTSIKN